MKIPWLLLLFVTNSVLELISLGLVGAYISLVVKTESLYLVKLDEVLTTIGFPDGSETRLIIIGLLLIGAFVIKTCAGIWINYTILFFGEQQRVRLTNYLMQAYQKLSYAEYLCRNSSEYIHSINNLTSQFAVVVMTILRTVSQAIVVLFIIIMLAWSNFMALSLLVILLGGMIWGYDKFFRQSVIELGERSNIALIKLVQGIHEGIEGLKEIRILGRESYFHQKVSIQIQQYTHNNIRNQTISLAPAFLMELMIALFIVLLVFISIATGEGLKEIIPTLGVFGLAAFRLKPASVLASSSMTKLRYSRDAIGRLFRDLKYFEHRSPKINFIKVKQAEDKVEFRCLELKVVNFTYPNSCERALKEVICKICAGESVGIVGPSGSGKTTLMDILLGLLEPQNGMILYNDRPLLESLEQWQSQIAYLPQQVFLLDATLRHNVALGIEEEAIDDDRLHKSLHQARLSELVGKLPKGINTLLGERGVRISGGQRQRVALARAFYHDRSILVMDEATSAIDTETEKEIIKEIDYFKGNKTMIIIAHRYTTVENCDRIYRIEKGRIVDQGSYDEVFTGHKYSVK
jgi:ATP-binding cassette, subfamily B, bacterial PglK